MNMIEVLNLEMYNEQLTNHYKYKSLVEVEQRNYFSSFSHWLVVDQPAYEKLNRPVIVPMASNIFQH